jgi:hypothetical protein
MSSLQQNWRKGQNRFCLEAREVRVRGRGRWGWGGGRNNPNNVCTYEYINKEKKEFVRRLNLNTINNPNTNNRGARNH